MESFLSVFHLWPERPKTRERCGVKMKRSKFVIFSICFPLFLINSSASPPQQLSTSFYSMIPWIFCFSFSLSARTIIHVASFHPSLFFPPLSLSFSLLSLPLRVLQDSASLLLYITATVSHSPLLHSASLLFSLLLSTHSDRMLPVISGTVGSAWPVEVDPDTLYGLKVFSRSCGSVGRGGRAGRGCRWRAPCRGETGCAALRQGLRRVMLHELRGFRTETTRASQPQCGALFRMAGTSGRERWTSWMLLGHSTGPYGNCAMQPSFLPCACLRYPVGLVRWEEERGFF